MLTAMAVWLAVSCSGWAPPVEGELLAGFAPADSYAGHWGVDWAAPSGSVVRSPISGQVSFAGSVAGMKAVTIRSGEVRFTVSYLSVIGVEVGDRVGKGSPVGLSGYAHGREAVHMSLRVGTTYLDPLRWCPVGRGRVRLVARRPGSAGRRSFRGEDRRSGRATAYPSPVMKRAIVGGTFNPPHLAHLLAGEAAFRQLGVEVVSFIPAGAPWQKQGHEVASAEHRWNMTRIAVDGVEYFQADDREVRRDGWTYTIETLESFGDDEIVLVLGADAAANLPTWERAAEVMERAAVAVAPRPGHDRRRVEEVLGDRFTWLDMPEVGISGTEIRERLRRGKSIRFLVREGVWDYINRHGVYSGSDSPGPV